MTAPPGLGRTSFAAGPLAGWIRPRADDDGRRVLLLHGGPGLPDYMDWVAEDLPDWSCASFQQRGLAPSTTEGPFDIATALADVALVLERLAAEGWDRPLVAGHSWGGHLAFHVAVSLADRISGALAIDPLGVVGDMGLPAFVAELRARTSDAGRARIDELDRIEESRPLTADEEIEGLEILWPAYFADPSHLYPFPGFTVSMAANTGLFASLEAERDALQARLQEVPVPVGAVAGALSPMPATASTDTVALIPGAFADVLEDAGHFPWFERPGCVRAALERLLSASFG